MYRWHVKNYLIGLMLLISIGAHAMGSLGENGYSDLSVDDPFTSDLAIQNLRRLIPQDKLGDAALKATREIRRYEYLFGPIQQARDCPSEWVCPGQPDDMWWVVKRKITIGLDNMTAQINSVLAQSGSHGCSSVNVGAASLALATQKMIEFRAPLSFTKRWCWGSATGDIASGSGSVVIRVSIETNSPSYQDQINLGSLRFNPSVDVKDISGTVFDLFDINSVAGQIFKFVFDVTSTFLFGDSIEGEMKKALDEVRNTDFSLYAVQANSGVSTARQLAALIGSAQFGSKLSYLVPAENVFVCKSGTCLFQMVEEQYVFDRRMKAAYRFKVCEITAIRSLNQVEKKRLIGFRDNLWKIAQDEYCSGNMQYYLQYSNPNIRNPKHLPIGSEITVPPAFTYILLHDRVVQLGDSLWTRWVVGDRSKSWKLYRRQAIDARNPNKIYPLQVLNIAPPTTEVSRR